ncbi:REP element-mobilizing transposase RayT [Natronincola peptidivorans]|uniref:REP element-mobilizing transposase RayT n=1 Tax=Natronincola peptidivorans TaxID=426128 RepID=A0A1H9ZIX5_9FIRM|nr:transposase [Natronincola peptidivorans]SES81283.1 REP element-mobilizing transposase RayT [Natronincola peptidivorans]
MGRKPRIEYKGGVYHVIQRGNNREYIFEKDKDKAYLLELVKEYKEMLNFHFYGFALMNNHYHFIIKTLDTPLQKIMHRINNKYSKYYNYRNSRTGHVFENRYKGILVMEDSYILSLLRYIHQNPVRAKLCNKVRDYGWSSDSYYRRNEKGEIVDIDFVLNIFSKNRYQAIKAYGGFMDMEKMEEGSVFEEVEAIGEGQEKAVEETVASIERKSLEDLLYEVTKDRTLYEEIKKGSRKRNLTNFKQQYIQQALAANYTMKEIGESLSISETSVFKMYHR